MGFNISWLLTVAVTRKCLLGTCFRPILVYWKANSSDMARVTKRMTPVITGRRHDESTIAAGLPRALLELAVRKGADRSVLLIRAGT